MSEKTSLRAFQAEIDSISHQAQLQHIQEIKAAEQAAADKKHHKGGGTAGLGSAQAQGGAAGNKGDVSGGLGVGARGKENVGVGGEGKKPATHHSKKDSITTLPATIGPSSSFHPDDSDPDPESPQPTIEQILHSPIPPEAIDDPTLDPLRTALSFALLNGHNEIVLELGAHPAPGYVYGSAADAASGGKAKVGVATAGLSGATKDADKGTEAVPTIGIPVKDLNMLESLRARLEVAMHGIKGEIVLLYLNPQDPSSAFATSDPSNPAPPSTTSTTPLPSTIITNCGPYATYILRLPPLGIAQITEIRIAVVGNVDAGKSTMLGVLTRGTLDDGRGRARVALFRHKHEVETGRTSSVGMEILGFGVKGEAVIPTAGHGHGHVQDSLAGGGGGGAQAFTPAAKREKMSWDEVCSKSAKVVSFIDLAGHERYLKTTLFGLTGCSPDYVMLIVGGNAGLIGMSKEHLGVALALQVPVIICVTKIDMTPAHVLEQTIKQLVKVLRSPGCRKIPVFVETAEQAVDCAKYLTSERICPIFLVSNVTGANLNMLRTLLNVLPSCQVGDKYQTDAPFEFNISDVFSVPFSGSVASGVITSGHVRAGDSVLLGPDSLGQFIPTVIKSIQRKRAPVEEADAGQSVSFALKKIRRAQLRKGQVIIARTEPPPKAVRRFEGQVLVLYHNTTIQPRYQAVCHVNSVRQTVRIVSLDHPKGLLRTGDRAKVIFEFVQGPEYIREGAKMLFREGKTRGLGVVTKILN